MKAGPHPALAQGKVRYVGDHVAVVIAETLAQAKDAAEAIVGRLRGAAGGGRRRRRRRARGVADPRGRAGQHRVPTGISATRRRSTRPSRGRDARHQARPRQQPPRPERHRAARGDRRVRRGHRRLHALHHQPEPARGAARAVGLHRHRARAQAARHRARRRRRLRLQDLHLRRGDGLRLGGEEGRPPGEVDARPHRGLPLPTRMAATTSPTPSWRWTRTARSSACASHTIANLGAYLSTFSSSVPTYLYAPLLSGQYDIPAIYCEVDGVYTNTAPVDAYRGAGRPEATFVIERLVEVAARELRHGSGRVPPAATTSRSFPHQTPVIMTYDAGDYHGLARPRRSSSPITPASRARKRESARSGKLRGIGFSSYIEACGIAPSAGGRLARRRRRPVGIGGGARQPDRHRSRC